MTRFAAAFVLLATAAIAQTTPQSAPQEPQRSYLLVVDGKVVTQTGYYHWKQDDGLRRYARTHPGTYLAFSDPDTLHRLDQPAAVKRIQELYQPMIPLGAEQAKLAAQQKPLSDRQAALAKEMQTAVGPEGVGRVGRLQGEVGQEQGRIGQEQGRIGEKQGEVGRALQAGFKHFADECLAAGTCPVVTP